MTTVTWCIFLPLLTAGILILIPAGWKGLIKTVALAGAVATFIISIGLMRGYLGGAAAPGDARAVLRAKQSSIIDKVKDDPGQEGIDRWRAAHFARDAATGKLTVQKPAAWATMSAAARSSWEEAAELELAVDVSLTEQMKFVEFWPWIQRFKINYFVGVDGLSLPLVLLTTLLCILCFIWSWTIDNGTKGYYILFLLLETGLIGVFCALDFFLFYVFWEIVLLPMYFLIGVWGGENRIYAAIKFFIYTLVGSVLMLIAMLVMFFLSEPHTFNMLALMQLVPSFSPVVASLLFIALFIGFAIKVPVFPFHTWLPDAHVEAPTAVSVILAGVLLKMGGYGLFRISYPMLPGTGTNKVFIALIAVLGMINIVYGAFCAMAQKDFKKLV
ncbi:MAG TPA: NADH-quinone oxidoreductase subunit M, partial [Planctomycetota bacterium]|nr:NADH-quinone oxidoreductase subunit M [Planctomycetota bacterium]